MKSPGGKSKGGLAQATKVLAEFSGESLPSEKLEFSGPIDVLVSDIPDVALQKWIHLVLFYNSTGMLDIFINGELYKSVAAMVTNESSGITIGAYKGNGGKIANVMFFQSPKKPTDALFLGGDAIDASTVHKLYNDFKTRDPPVVGRVFPIQNPFAKAEEQANAAQHQIAMKSASVQNTFTLHAPTPTKITPMTPVHVAAPEPVKPAPSGYNSRDENRFAF